MKTINIYFIAFACALLASCSNVPLSVSDEPTSVPVAENPTAEAEEPQNPEVPVIPEDPDTPLFDEDDMEDGTQQAIAYVPISFTSAEKAVNDKLNTFAWQLFRETLDDSSFNGNGSISPVSVTSALSIAINGADANTLDCMMQTLGLNASDLDALNSYYAKIIAQMPELDNTSTVELYNSLWQTEEVSFLPDFVNTAADVYDATLFNTTYSTIVDDVNAWCNECTHGIIPKIMNDPSDFSIANAIYFKGNWENKFDRDLTDYGVFNCLSGRVRTVPFMHKYDTFYGGFGDTHRVLGMKIGNGAFSFYVILPREGKTLAQCVDNIVANNRLWLYPSSGEKDLALPKYKINNNINLRDILIQMGMGDAFDTAKANFSKMSNSPIFISGVSHATSIKIDEGGTVLAASTDIGWATAPEPEDPEDFHVDRPFLFVVMQNDSNTPVLIGKIEEL